MNTEKIIEELERENAFLRHEIWMDGENRIQIRKYLDEQRQNRAVSEVIADRVEFIERKEKNAHTQNSAAGDRFESMGHDGLLKQVKELSWKLDVLYRMIDSLTRRIHEIKKVC